MEDLDPPPALSVHASDLISHALAAAFERDYTHLTVISKTTRSLVGYLSIPRLRTLLRENRVQQSDAVEAAMQRFERKGRMYRVITMETPLEELEAFFARGVDGGGAQDFAIVTDGSRRFVLGVATRNDLEEFARRRP